ncbi:MAG TPA: MurT ligase domain-containing protein, partial [Patescibacteria group bacterium]|nr:MurT ligase domain-containing protein [Patescibacteria group bacterium]
IIALNLFRDQLDRYGELDAIAKKWKDSFVHLSEKTSLILNADDPLIAFLGSDIKIPVKYFGLEEKGKETVSAADTLYCPRCRERLRFTKTYYAHLGIWSCPKCNFTRPTPESIAIRYPLEGTYNRYNTLAAAIAAKTIGITEKNIQESLTKVTPAFGRQEKLTVKGKKIQILLSKNPTSMNESLQTIQEKGATHILFVLNDRIPDGRDVSWIWDIALESYVENFRSIFVGGDRAYDMALRLQYAQEKQTENFITDDHLPSLLQKATTAIPQNETLYILPTYSAMLEVRKLLLGRKML